MNLHNLRKYLLSTCRYVQSESGVQTPDTSALWVEWVVARSLCVFRSIDVSAISGKELEAFLQMQVREWAPFAQPEHHLQVHGNRALVWVWDGERRRLHTAEQKVTPDVILPESVLREPGNPALDVGVELIECIDGYEGRGFRGTRQVVSRWWRDLPDPVSWGQFNMLMDVDPAMAVPSPASSRLRPVGESSLRALLIPFLRAESTLFVIAFALFMVAAAYQLAGIGYATIATSQTEDRIAELNEAVTPVLTARDEALLALDSIENISALHAGPLQLQYIADLLGYLATARAAGQDVNLMAWEYRQETVAISVTSPELSSSELLTLFEGIPWLQEQRVADDTVKGRMRVSGTLIPDWVFVEEQSVRSDSSTEVGAL